MTQHPKSATSYLREADRILLERATQRDTPNGERSMEAAVAAFNILTSHNLTETDGWKFMKILKMARARTGEYNEDDYTDGVAYSALEAESASREQAVLQYYNQGVQVSETLPLKNNLPTSFPFDEKLKV